MSDCAVIDDAEGIDAPEAMALAVGAARAIAMLRARSAMHAEQARCIVRAARKSQAMPRNPVVLEPLHSMRGRAALARRQWVAAVVEVLRWVNS